VTGSFILLSNIDWQYSPLVFDRRVLSHPVRRRSVRRGREIISTPYFLMPSCTGS
jgi:hypothetical protein